MTYKPTTPTWDCIFCKIAAGEFPPLGNGLIYDDEKYMARLSPFPNTPWFTVVIPKAHFWSDVLHMPEEDLQEFILIAKKVAKMIEDYYPDVGRVGLMMEGTGIDHAHIKLYPMHGTEFYTRWEFLHIPSDNKQFFETYAWYMFSNDRPQADFEELERVGREFKIENRK